MTQEEERAIYNEEDPPIIGVEITFLDNENNEIAPLTHLILTITRITPSQNTHND